MIGSNIEFLVSIFSLGLCHAGGFSNKTPHLLPNKLFLFKAWFEKCLSIIFLKEYLDYLFL